MDQFSPGRSAQPQYQYIDPSTPYPLSLPDYIIYPYSNYPSGTEVCASSWQSDDYVLGATGSNVEVTYGDPWLPSGYDYYSWGGETGPGYAIWGPGGSRDDTFALTSNGSMGHIYSSGGWGYGSVYTDNWGGYFGNKLTRSAAASFGNYELDVFGMFCNEVALQITTDAFWSNWDDGSWSGWQELTNPLNDFVELLWLGCNGLPNLANSGIWAR